MKKSGLFFVFILICINAVAQNSTVDRKKSKKNHLGNIWEVKAGEDLQAIIPLLQQGDQLVLHEGVYEGSIILSNSGSEDFPIIIRGYGNGEKRPVLNFEGQPESFLSSPLVKITGNNLILDYLKLKSKKTYCLRIGKEGEGSNNITIKKSVFSECGGGDISANYPNARYDNIHILDNYFAGSKRTSVYIGNHHGKSPVTNFIFGGNVIDGSQNDGPESTIGYGIELKLNVTKSIVENNFITGTKGPGIMVYGAENSGKYNSNIVRSNIVVNSREEAGIVVGGGPSLIQNNVVIKSKYGLYFQNYANRGLFDNVVISGNTLLNYRNYGISFGNNKHIIAEDNSAISSVGSNAFTDNPNAGTGNKKIRINNLLDKLSNDVMNSIPKRDNLDKIWRHASSGSLNKNQLETLIRIILKYKRPTKVIY